MKFPVALHDPPAPEAAVPTTNQEPAPHPPATDPEFLQWLEELL